MDHFQPCPKPERVELNPKDYTKLKDEMWEAGFRSCNRCHEYVPRNEAHYHHIIPKSRGRMDTKENGEIVCWKCHRLIEDGKI